MKFEGNLILRSQGRVNRITLDKKSKYIDKYINKCEFSAIFDEFSFFKLFFITLILDDVTRLIRQSQTRPSSLIFADCISQIRS